MKWARRAVASTLGFFCCAAFAGESEFKQLGPAFLKKHCTECHGDTAKKAGIDLRNYSDDLSILKDIKTWQTLLQVMEDGDMPPEKKPRPDAAESKKFLDAVRAVFKNAESKVDPGRVTIRRLNKSEYNNTVRDLLGIEFYPAEDFPSDEIGYGFDNIGDVLALSPVLMERYLGAAETISQTAIVAEVPKPTKRWQGGKYLEPAGKDVPDKKFRPIHSKPGAPTLSGPLHTGYRVPADGEYTFQARMYGESPSGKPVRVAILAVGKNVPNPASDADVAKLTGGSLQGLRPFTILKTVEIKARESKKAEVVEIKVPPMEFGRIAIALFKPSEDELKPTEVAVAPPAKSGESKEPAKKPDDQKPASQTADASKGKDEKKDDKDGGDKEKPVTDVGLYVEHFMLEGPLDMRPAFHRSLHAPDQKPTTELTRTALKKFVTRAYRRPATETELNRLVKLVETAEAGGNNWAVGMQLAMQAVLVSPKFLFRVELDDRVQAPEPRPLDEYQLASRLSYFLWSSMPDDELFALAEKGQLSANLDAQVKRMLKNPKAKSLVTNFATQWLQIRRLQAFEPDPKMFAKFNDRLRSAMMRETELFVQTIIDEDRSILDLINADFTFVNETLARHYGIQDTNGTLAGQKPVPGGKPIRGREFVRVTIPDGQRGGLLTQASILTVTSNPTRTSPVKRGRWVLEQILGAPPPPPPPDVPDLAEAKHGELTGTLRQRMEQHRADPNCAGCHAKMDPLGFAFENFDAIGAFRTKDENQPIDATGTLPDGVSFNGAMELKKVLHGKKDQFAKCLAEKLMTYALGRGLKYYDEPALKKIVEALEKNGYRFSALASEVAQSAPFRMRRGTQEQAEEHAPEKKTGVNLR